MVIYQKGQESENKNQKVREKLYRDKNEHKNEDKHFH